MNLETDLGRGDRATLAAWQVLNVVGWAAVAFAVTVGLHALVDALTTAWLSGCCNATSLTFTAVAGDETSTVGHLVLRGGLSVGLGAVVGAIVGPRQTGKSDANGVGWRSTRRREQSFVDGNERTAFATTDVR